jgi:hypothetical protein
VTKRKAAIATHFLAEELKRGTMKLGVGLMDWRMGERLA